MKHYHVFVNGYGIPKDILKDQNYTIYLNGVLDWLGSRASEYNDDKVTLYLSGGATDPARPELTEAEAMHALFLNLLANRRAFSLSHFSYHLITDAHDSRQGLDVLYHGLVEKPIIFCEWARQDRVRYLAKRHFEQSEVVPINFDRATWRDRLRQMPRNLLSMIGYHSNFVRNTIELPLRRRHITRAAR